MTVLYLNLFVVYVCSFLSRLIAKPDITNLDYEQVKPHKLFILFALSSLVLVSGLRNNIGDTFYYLHSYENHPVTWEAFEFSGDFGFELFQLLLLQFSTNPQYMIFATALLTNTLIVMTFYNYSRLIEISLYVYITLGFYLVSMNGIRQYLAAAIVFAGTKYLINGDWKKYMLVVLLASTFHQTALILIPIYFIVRQPAWSKMTIALLLFSILIVVSFDEFMNLLFTAIGDTQYGGYRMFDEGGANIIRVLVTAVPIIIAFLGRHKLKEIMPGSDVIVNMSLLSFVFITISTQNWIFARFSIYFGLYLILLFGWLVKIFAEKDQKLVYYGILICCFIYFYIEHVLSLNIIYQSDFIQI